MPHQVTTEDPQISVIIPCYCSDESLSRLVARLETVFSDVIQESYEILLINDGSPDPKTWTRIQDLSGRHPHVRGFQLMRNFGKPSAEMCGYAHARGRWCLQMDDDLQHPPEEIPKLLKMREHDVVMGNFPRRQHGAFSRLCSRIKGWFDRILIDKPPGIYVSPFRLLRREVVNAIVKINTPRPFIPALIFHVTRDVVQTDVAHDKREFGRSTYTFKKKVQQFSNLLINNSSFLLQIIAWVGIGFATVSVLFTGWLLFRRFFLVQPVAGWTSLMVVLMLIGGMVMFALGVVGEYLKRIINGLENRPTYITREEICGPALETPPTASLDAPKREKEKA